jgi:hypothetical protein
MSNRKSQAGTNADSSTKDEKIFVSQHSRKPNVGSSLFVSTKELFPVNKRLDLSQIDFHFSFRHVGEDIIPIAHVPLYDYLRCVEMLQAAEYQISVLQEAVSKKQQENQ